MKIISIIPFALLAQTSFWQIDHFYNCKDYGMYRGKMDSVIKDEINHIYVKLDLLQDSTYSYEIGGVFSWCTSRTFTSTGRWLSDSGWVYFKPDRDQYGIDQFRMYHPKWFTHEYTKDETRHMGKYGALGFEHALQFTNDGSQSKKIFFRIDWDCFDNYWFNRSIEKVKH